MSRLDVDPETREELRTSAHGRVLLIDYFPYAARWGFRFGDVRFRWLDDRGPLPDHTLLLTDDEPTTFIMAELGPLLVHERARLRMSDPRRPDWLRRTTIVIADGGPWLAFFEARPTPLGLRR